MNSQKTVSLIIFISALSIYCSVNFDAAMGKNHHYSAHYFNTVQRNQRAQNTYDRLAQIYNKKISLLEQNNVEQSNALRIPKIIHQIWLGSPVPEQFKSLMNTWQKQHPDWEYMLWTDELVAQLNLLNQDLYDAAINYAERSDIARYEILYRFGGLYIDTDFECLQRLDALHYAFDLYCGIELPGMAEFLGHTIMIPNSIIGCKAGHPIMNACIHALRTTQHLDDIVKRSGPILFTQMFLEHANIHGTNDIALPALYFYPIDKQTKERAKITSCLCPYTYAIHHWAGSWILKEGAFVPGIKIKTRQEGTILKFSIIDERK